MSALEDAYEDIIAKAQRGLGLSDLTLMERSGLSMMEIESAKSGTFDPDASLRLAESLDLDPDALAAIGNGAYQPEISLPDGVKMFTMPAPVPGYEEMTVNAFLLFSPQSREAVLFDTATSLDPILEFVQKESLEVKYVVLTHTHPDHVEALPAAREAFKNARFLTPAGEPVDGLNQIRPGNTFSLTGLQIEARSTPGHSPAGTTYIVSGLSTPVAVVGDALFAGSIGGVPAEKYADALEAIRTHILDESAETLVLPGHKSPTTVGQEKAHNPFFAKK